MSYTTQDFKSKAEVKRELIKGTKITCFQPGLGQDLTNWTGSVSLEGPHYPKPHKWYGQGIMKDGLLIKIS